MRSTILCTTAFGLLGSVRAAVSLEPNRTWGNERDRASAVCEQNEDEIFRWASSGGGWRAMVADMAFANVFRQAGVITDDSSLFSAVSTESGGSWFSTQFFYSQQFFSNTALSTPSHLYDFVLGWMNAYQSLPLTRKPECDFLKEIDDKIVFQELADFCNVIIDYDGNWASFISDMMDITSANYGDPEISSRSINPELRVAAMSQTDLYVQTSLVPSSRLRSKDIFLDKVVYINSKNGFKILSIPICVQWSVSNEDASYFTNAPSDSFPTDTAVHEDSTPKDFSFSDWERFFLFPAPKGKTQISTPITYSSTGGFRIPFDGNVPHLAQIAAASSAAAGFLSPVVPSTLAQAASVFRYSFKGLNKPEDLLAEKALHIGLDLLYKTALLDDLAVCSQWPNKCGERDGRFIDGGFTDSITAALNIGHYQTKQGGDLSKTIKLVMTSNGMPSFDPSTFLAYFSTPLNQGVKPGEFLWPRNFTSRFLLPVYSIQIFEEYLDMDLLESQTETLNGLNVTTFQTTATTINNPAFNTIAGQKVEILLLRLNADISTVIVGPTAIELYKEPLAEMAEGIAGSSQFVDRVHEFFCHT